MGEQRELEKLLRGLIWWGGGVGGGEATVQLDLAAGGGGGLEKPQHGLSRLEGGTSGGSGPLPLIPTIIPPAPPTKNFWIPPGHILLLCQWIHKWKDTLVSMAFNAVLYRVTPVHIHQNQESYCMKH